MDIFCGSEEKLLAYLTDKAISVVKREMCDIKSHLYREFNSIRLSCKEVFSTIETLHYLNISMTTLRKWIKHDGFPRYLCPDGRSYFYKKSEIDEWLCSKKIYNDTDQNISKCITNQSSWRDLNKKRISSARDAKMMFLKQLILENGGEYLVDEYIERLKNQNILDYPALTNLKSSIYTILRY